MPLPLLAIDTHWAGAIELLTGGPPDEQAAPRSLLHVGDGVAVIELRGPMLRDGGRRATSTARLTEAVRTAANDPRVRAIVLRVDSPGGSVDGLAELGDAVWQARQRKMVVAQVEGQAASAAYYVASQATRVVAGRMDTVGSIGTFLYLLDWSQWFERAGVRPVLITTGTMKAIGAPGVEITAEQEQYLRDFVEQYFADFRRVVARGRGLSAERVEALADGRMFVAPEALRLGLIDAYATIDETMDQLEGRGVMADEAQREQRNESTSQAGSTQGAERVAVQVDERATAGEQPATIDQMIACCAGIDAWQDADFLVAQLQRGATLAEAQRAWMERLCQTSARERQEREALERRLMANAAPAGRTLPGVSDLAGAAQETSDAPFEGDPIGFLRRAIAERRARGMSASQAASAVNREYPGLVEAAKQQANAGRRGG